MGKDQTFLFNSGSSPETGYGGMRPAPLQSSQQRRHLGPTDREASFVELNVHRLLPTSAACGLCPC